MVTPENSHNSPVRKRAVLLALRYYGREMARLRRFTVPGILLTSLGTTCISYVAPLVVAQLVGRLASHKSFGISAAVPYVLGLAGVLLVAEIAWRIGIHCLNRLEGGGIEHLYVIGMDELLAKDAAFFHDNFAGSLTKRVLSFAARYEDFTDNLVFNIVGSFVPLIFASVVLWRYQLVVLDHGQITEKGTHQELLGLDGTYARLWQHQSGGFLDDNAATALLAGPRG